MIKVIQEFSESDGHGSLSALAIMSHGNMLGDIIGYEGRAVSVQQVIDSFSSAQLQSVPKVQYNGYVSFDLRRSVQKTLIFCFFFCYSLGYMT